MPRDHGHGGGAPDARRMAPRVEWSRLAHLPARRAARGLRARGDRGPRPRRRRALSLRHRRRGPRAGGRRPRRARLHRDSAAHRRGRPVAPLRPDAQSCSPRRSPAAAAEAPQGDPHPAQPRVHGPPHRVLPRRYAPRARGVCRADRGSHPRHAPRRANGPGSVVPRQRPLRRARRDRRRAEPARRDRDRPLRRGSSARRSRPSACDESASSESAWPRSARRPG